MFVALRLTLWLYPPETASRPGVAAFLRGELRKMGLVFGSRTEIRGADAHRDAALW